MKRLLLSIMALVMFVVNIANAASVKVEMNSTSPTMSLAEKTTGDAVDVVRCCSWCLCADSLWHEGQHC